MPHPRLEDLFYGVVTVGERGQIVIPAEARRQQGFKPGDKLLVFAHPFGHGIILTRLDQLQETIANTLAFMEQVRKVGERDRAQGRTSSKRKRR
jgi:AbrB family looped-hinge helix DNA binding protein